MSDGPFRPHGKRRGARRAGPDKPATRHFSRIPEPARLAVCRVLEARGLGALIDLCAGLRLDLAEVLRLRQYEDGRFLLDDDEIPLPAETVSRLEHMQRTVDAACPRREKQAEWLSAQLKLVTREVRRSLRGEHRWVDNMAVSAQTLHHAADEEADRCFGEDVIRLRHYRRTASIPDGTVRPSTTTKVADAFEEALDPLLVEIDGHLTDRARAALDRLGGTR